MPLYHYVVSLNCFTIAQLSIYYHDWESLLRYFTRTTINYFSAQTFNLYYITVLIIASILHSRDVIRAGYYFRQGNPLGGHNLPLPWNSDLDCKKLSKKPVFVWKCPFIHQRSLNSILGWEIVFFFIKLAHFQDCRLKCKFLGEIKKNASFSSGFYF